MPEKNKLYYGDNLDVLRRYVKDETVDLVYLDPPFNSRQDYNVLFAEKDGTRSSSQIMAFEDTWEWNLEAERSYVEIVGGGGRIPTPCNLSVKPRCEENRSEESVLQMARSSSGSSGCNLVCS